MKFSFKISYSELTEYLVKVDLTINSKPPPAVFYLKEEEWEALKQILGAGAVAMQMQGQDIQVEVK